MNIDHSRVKKGIPCLYAEHPGFIKHKPDWNRKAKPDSELVGPLVMTGKVEYYGNGADDLLVEVFGQTKDEPEGQACFMLLSELIMVH